MTITMCSTSAHLNTRIPAHPPPVTPISRRLLLSLSLPPLLLITTSPPPPPALALSLGISGPKDWLKEQKRKSIKYLLAPIDASRDILRYAYQSLLSAKDGRMEEKDAEEIRRLLISAGRDCVPADQNSLVAFQAKTGVEVCTFKLVVKNASSLLDDKDPAKVEAEAVLSDLVRSFTILNGIAKEANVEVVSDREKVAGAVVDTLSWLDKFEDSVKGCIDV